MNRNNNNPMNMIMQLMASGGNPQVILNNYIQKNPQARAVLTQMQQSGMTPQQYVMQYAKQNNIDINPMLNQMKQNGLIK